jgi:hypothetical protein
MVKEIQLFSGIGAPYFIKSSPNQRILIVLDWSRRTHRNVPSLFKQAFILFQESPGCAYRS